MGVETGLRSKVTSHIGIAALIGTRFYPAADVPQDAALPLATYSMDKTPLYSHAGETGYTQARTTINIYSATRDNCTAIARAFRDCLAGYRGTMDDITAHGILIDAISDAADLPDSAQEQPIFMAVVDALIMFTDNRPAG